MTESWQAISKRKKAEQASRIPKAWRLPENIIASAHNHRANVLQIPRTCGLLTKKELEITGSFDATGLAEQIRNGRLKTLDVTTAFCKRAAIAHQLTNCLTEILFKEAIERANALDAHLAAGNSPLGPLHGVPISLKDTFCIAGHDASIGLAALAFQPCTSTSTLVDILLQAGAILYCKTNVPQTLMALDSHNNVFGRTLNPINAALTAGGSSGGEGALIAMRGSVLGVGTDVGGSIRIPAMCNGLYGFKPSWQRIPYSGQQGGQLEAVAKLGLPASAGPLATSLRDCELLMKTVSDQRPWGLDSDVVPGYWEDQNTCSQKNLVVGVVRTDGLIEPLPPIKKILDEVSSTLHSSGVRVVDLDISSIFSNCQSLANALFGVEGGNNMFDLLEKCNEPLSPWLSARLKRKPPMALDKVRDLHARRERLQKEFLRVWRDDGNGGDIDVIICPVAPHPVPEVDRWNGVSYTSSFVLLDYPAGTIPVRAFTHADMEGTVSSEKPLSSWDKVNRELWTQVDRSVYLGSPLSIQVIAPKLQERKLYDAMKILDGIINSKDDRARDNITSKL